MGGNLTETQIQKQILDYLDAKGCLYWRANQIPVAGRTFKGLKGVADILLVMEPFGTLVGIEVKKPGGKQSEAQVEFEKRLRARGGIYLLVDNVQDVIRWLRAFQSV